MAGACNLSYFGGWGRRIAWTQEAEVTVSQNRATALQPGWQRDVVSKHKNKNKLEKKNRRNLSLAFLILRRAKPGRAGVDGQDHTKVSCSPRREGSSWTFRLRCPELPGVDWEFEFCFFLGVVSAAKERNQDSFASFPLPEMDGCVYPLRISHWVFNDGISEKIQSSMVWLLGWCLQD